LGGAPTRLHLASANSPAKTNRQRCRPCPARRTPALRSRSGCRSAFTAPGSRSRS